jgi:hypothetical protein
MEQASAGLLGCDEGGFSLLRESGHDGEVGPSWNVNYYIMHRTIHNREEAETSYTNSGIVRSNMPLEVRTTYALPDYLLLVAEQQEVSTRLRPKGIVQPSARF